MRRPALADDPDLHHQNISHPVEREPSPKLARLHIVAAIPNDHAGSASSEVSCPSFRFVYCIVQLATLSTALFACVARANLVFKFDRVRSTRAEQYRDQP
jgi:hypothetical protein